MHLHISPFIFGFKACVSLTINIRRGPIFQLPIYFDQTSITYIDFADALVYSALPTILVSCKCDNPVNTRQIDTESIEAACLAEVETVKTAANVPESARLCLGAMLRAIMANRIG